VCATMCVCVCVCVSERERERERERELGLLVDKNNVINHQLVISYRPLRRILTNQPTVDSGESVDDS
jgi:hypothetical protein